MDNRFKRNTEQKLEEKEEMKRNQEIWTQFENTNVCSLCEYVKKLSKQRGQRTKLFSSKTPKDDKLQDKVGVV